MLLYLFESKDGLVRELLARARQDELAAIQGIEGDLEAVTATLWEWLAAPSTGRCWCSGSRRTRARWSTPTARGPAFARQTVEDWSTCCDGPAAAVRRGTGLAERDPPLAPGDATRATAALRPEIRPRADAHRTR